MTTRFETYVRKQVDAFLQTVVMIDDEAMRPPTGEGDPGVLDFAAGSEATRAGSAEPVFVSLEDDEEWDDAPPSPGVRTQALTAPVTDGDAAHSLDPVAATVAFASRGLCCTILSPQNVAENRQLRQPFVRAARRADVLILDWNLNGDSGKAALALIEAVLRDDAKELRRRLRVLAIYTGETNLEPWPYR